MTTKIKYPPLIITLKTDEGTQEYFTALRKKHFPKHVNYLDAHITLFHRLPSELDLIYEQLSLLSKRSSFSATVNEIRNMGNGVAFGIHSPVIDSLHKELQKCFAGYLISQDRQKIWPHITVQNKVTAHKASILHQELIKDFKPFEIQIVGVSCWLYRDGPWEFKKELLFDLPA